MNNTPNEFQLDMFEQFRLLDRIDDAIERLSKLKTTPTIEQSIKNLKYKRSLVESGNYVVRQVNEDLVAGFGREIARLTKTSFTFSGMHLRNGKR